MTGRAIASRLRAGATRFIRAISTLLLICAPSTPLESAAVPLACRSCEYREIALAAQTITHAILTVGCTVLLNRLKMHVYLVHMYQIFLKFNLFAPLA